MAQSWRIETNEVDNTERTTTSTPIIGASVIVSPKGPNTFTKFNKGDTQGVLNTFGYPSKDYPMIQDALDIVSECSMWFASPYKNGTYGGAFITKSMGTIPFNSGVETKTISDYSQVSFTNIIGIGNGANKTFTFTIPYIEKYNASSLTLSVGGTAKTISINHNQSTGIETITDSANVLDTGSTLDTNSGVLTLKFKNAIPSATTVSIGYTMDMSDTYFVLFDKNMQEDDLQIQVSASSNVDGAFEIIVARWNPISSEYVEVNNSPFLVGLSPTSKDSYGDNIYIENVFGDNQTLFDAHVVTSIFTTFVDDVEMVNLNGGSRGDSVDGTDIVSIYDSLKNTSKYQIKFCMDSSNTLSNHDKVIEKFVELRANSQKRCRFVYCADNVSGATIVNDEHPHTTYGYGIQNQRGFYQYCLNWGIHKDIYQGNDFLCSNMGLICKRIVIGLENGTSCPAWINEGADGGILGSSVIKLMQEGTDEITLKMLDELCFNPVVNDYNYGAMIVSWRTRQVKKTIFSNIPQSSLADTVIELVEKEVMPNRIGKLIDESSYSRARQGCNEIMSAYQQFFEDYYVWCDNKNNTADTKNKEQLIITIGVIFKNYARTVVLNFITDKNGVDVKESLLNN